MLTWLVPGGIIPLLDSSTAEVFPRLHPIICKPFNNATYAHMFKSRYLSEGVSICLRCQHRRATRPSRNRESPSPLSGIRQSRTFSHHVRQSQDQVQYDTVSPNVRDAGSASRLGISYVGHRPGRIQYHKHRGQDRKDAVPTASVQHKDTSHLDYRPDLRYGQRHIKLYRKDPLGVDSLGLPAEVLVLTTRQQESPRVLHVREPDERVKEEAPSSADEMLGKLRAEQGIPSERGIAENLAELRDTWTSHRKRKERPLSSGEQEELMERLDAGFTAKQLVGYYTQAGSGKAVGPADLHIPYSTGTYTRSAWYAGSTPFPGDASARLKACRSMLDGFEETEVRLAGDGARLYIPTVTHRTPKRAVIERILWECWHFKPAMDEEASGELDIWIRPEHNQLLLNHSRPNPYS